LIPPPPEDLAAAEEWKGTAREERAATAVARAVVRMVQVLRRESMVLQRELQRNEALSLRLSGSAPDSTIFGVSLPASEISCGVRPSDFDELERRSTPRSQRYVIDFIPNYILPQTKPTILLPLTSFHPPPREKLKN
jgi:hypothetical protein